MLRHCSSIALILYYTVARVIFSLIPRYMRAVLFLCTVICSVKRIGLQKQISTQI